MPLICYEPKKFKAATLEVIDQANAIIAAYAAEGYSLTLRQIYYQCDCPEGVCMKDAA